MQTAKAQLGRCADGKTTAASDVLILMLIDPNARRRSYATNVAIAVSFHCIHIH